MQHNKKYWRHWYLLVLLVLAVQVLLYWMITLHYQPIP